MTDWAAGMRSRLATAHARIAELESERDALARAQPVWSHAEAISQRDALVTLTVEQAAQIRELKAECDRLASLIPGPGIRDGRQSNIHSWAKAAFGEREATSLPQRGLRLLEEATEAAQATGVDEYKAHDLVAYVFSRPVGQLNQELGGTAVCVLALAAAAGLSADDEEAREVYRVLSKPIKHFTKRNQAKNDAGFLAISPAKKDGEP